MDYNYFYNKEDFYFGEKPSVALKDYISKYNIKPCTVVDIGAGEGRNSFYLAKQGFTVVAIEPSDVGVKKMINYAKQNEIQIEIIKADFFNGVRNIFNIDFFIASTVLNHFSLKEIIQAKKEIYSRLNQKGYIFVSVFTEDDPGFLQKDVPEASECRITIKRYFKQNELKELFSDWRILEYREEYFQDLTHGKPHYHGIAILFAQKNVRK